MFSRPWQQGGSGRGRGARSLAGRARGVPRSAVPRNDHRSRSTRGGLYVGRTRSESNGSRRANRTSRQANVLAASALSAIVRISFGVKHTSPFPTGLARRRPSGSWNREGPIACGRGSSLGLTSFRRNGETYDRYARRPFGIGPFAMRDSSSTSVWGNRRVGLRAQPALSAIARRQTSRVHEDRSLRMARGAVVQRGAHARPIGEAQTFSVSGLPSSRWTTARCSPATQSTISGSKYVDQVDVKERMLRGHPCC